MVEITILELNLDRADFTANTPWNESTEEVDSEEGGLPVGMAMGGVVAVLAAVVLVTVAKRLRGGDDESSGGGRL